MKQNGILMLTAALALIFGSCGEKKNKQDADANTSHEVEQTKEQAAEVAKVSFSDVLAGNIFGHYQQIRTALVNSDADKVKTAAGNLAERFSGDQKEMKSTAMAMADAGEIEKQRELFSELTAKVEPLFKESISEGTIYKQFCPMAFEGKGGYWISNVDEIRNPYYGDKMLKCGKVTEKIQ